MNWKLIFSGGIAMYVSQFIITSITGMFIHQGILNEPYKANSTFWRPELAQEPPNMAALMPLWITTGIITALIIAAIYSKLRPAFTGATLSKGLKFGLMVWLIQACYSAALFGVFNLPATIWTWWAIDGIAMYAVGGMVLAWVAEKVSPE